MTFMLYLIEKVISWNILENKDIVKYCKNLKYWSSLALYGWCSLSRPACWSVRLYLDDMQLLIIYNIAGTGRIIEAEKVLRKAANINKRTLPQLNFATQVIVHWEIEFVLKLSV